MEAINIQSGVQPNYAQQRKERFLTTHMPIRFDIEPSAEKDLVNNHVKQCFANTYGANVEVFEPYILSTFNERGIVATIGFQPAATKVPLFLESYLDDSVEQTLSKILNQSIKREKIVEVGNLSSSHSGSASRILFILSVAILYQAGFKWVTFTATKQVQRLLGKLNLQTVPVCQADPEKLVDKGASWGSYYDNNPTVVVGNLTEAIETLKSHKVISSILENYHKTISDAAAMIAI